MNPSPSETRKWREVLAPYREPSLPRSIVELVLSAAPLAALWVAAWVLASFGLWWAAILLTVPAAGFLVRLFIVQHDCGHQAFFRNKAANNWIGRILGVLTLTPYDCWRQTHAVHHATSGDLDRRGLGGVAMLTVEEYQAAGFWKRLGYRLYRHPLILFGLGPAYVFMVEQRLPSGLMRQGWRPWVSAMGTNAAILSSLVLAGVLGGWQGLLFVYLPTVLMGASAGVWLFYVQHQFEHTSWDRHANWDLGDAALHGSSHYDLPPVLRWMTGNIGVHHVHHLDSHVPFYRLQRILRDQPGLAADHRMTGLDSLRCIKLGLWDESTRRLVSFSQARRARPVRAFT